MSRLWAKIAFGGYGSAGLQSPQRNYGSTPAPAAPPPPPPPPTPGGLTSPHATANAPAQLPIGLGLRSMAPPRSPLAPPTPPLISPPAGTRGILPTAAYPDLHDLGHMQGIDTRSPHFRTWWQGQQQDPYSVQQFQDDPARLLRFYGLQQGLHRDLAQPAYGGWWTNLVGHRLGMRREAPDGSGNVIEVLPAWAHNIAGGRPPAGSNVQQRVRPARSWGQFAEDVGGAAWRTAGSLVGGAAVAAPLLVNAVTSGDTAPLESLGYDLMRVPNAILDTDVGGGDADMRVRPRYGVGLGSGVNTHQNRAGARHLFFGHNDYLTNEFVPSIMSELSGLHSQEAAAPGASTAERIAHRAAAKTTELIPIAAGLLGGAGIGAPILSRLGRLGAALRGSRAAWNPLSWPGAALQGAAAAPEVAGRMTGAAALGTPTIAAMNEIPTGGGINLEDRISDIGYGLRQPGVGPQWLRNIGANAVEAAPFTALMGLGLGGLGRNAATGIGNRVASAFGRTPAVNPAAAARGGTLRNMALAQTVGTGLQSLSPGHPLQAVLQGMPSDQRREFLRQYNEAMQALSQQIMAENPGMSPEDVEQAAQQQLFAGEE